MDLQEYQNWVKKSLSGDDFSEQLCLDILTSPEVELLPLLNAAFEIRKSYMGKEVMIHIINNSQNGYCPEDCGYCAQAKTSSADIEAYPLKSDEEILAEAERAYTSGAYRYCMVFAGRGPSSKRVEHLAHLIKEIKKRYPLRICISTGLLDEQKAQLLKEAGLDRLNHNLNTSENHYPHICTTHTYADRLQTLSCAQKAGLEICSGLIVGMGETSIDIIEIAKTLRALKSPSIPVNFLIPIPGTQLNIPPRLTPEYCLRVLCLFRFLNPRSEIRVAAGREFHLRSLEVMSLYPANSLFMDGYLNARGSSRLKTLQMIQDAGFTIQSNISLSQLLEQELKIGQESTTSQVAENPLLKSIQQLRPYWQKNLIS